MGQIGLEGGVGVAGPIGAEIEFAEEFVGGFKGDWRPEFQGKRALLFGDGF